MFVITLYDKFRRKKWLGYQDTGNNEGIPVIYNYIPMDWEGYISNIANSSKEHPTYFKTKKDAEDFIQQLKQYDDTYISKISNQYTTLRVESAMDFNFPKCGLECWKCNKKNKYSCKKLSNKYQNICGFIMAKFDNNTVNLNPKRLDAPCEQCINKSCQFYQGH